MSVTQKVRIALVGAEDAIKAVHAHLVSAGEHFNEQSQYKCVQLLDKLEDAFFQAVSDAEKALGLSGGFHNIPAPGTEAALMAGDPSIPSVDNKGPALVADAEIIPAKPADPEPSGETLIPVEVAQAATSGTLTQEIPGEVLDVHNPGPALVEGKPVEEGGIVAKDEAAVAALVDLVKEVDVPDPGETQTITAADVGELKL